MIRRDLELAEFDHLTFQTVHDNLAHVNIVQEQRYSSKS